MHFEEILAYFLDRGASLHISEEVFRGKLQSVSNFVFDWDGVFNKGIKTDPTGSPFSEPDSMGTNLMRLSWYLESSQLATMGIMTGAQNKGALYFARREHFDFIIRGYKNKNVALDKLNDQFGFDPGRTLFAWDDILDLPVAKWAGVSIQMRRDANPGLSSFAVENDLVDYVTAFPGGDNGVREIAELYLAARGNAEACIRARMQYSGTYKSFLDQKMACKTIEIQKTG